MTDVQHLKESDKEQSKGQERHGDANGNETTQHSDKFRQVLQMLSLGALLVANTTHPSHAETPDTTPKIIEKAAGPSSIIHDDGTGIDYPQLTQYIDQLNELNPEDKQLLKNLISEYQALNQASKKLKNEIERMTEPTIDIVIKILDLSDQLEHISSIYMSKLDPKITDQNTKNILFLALSGDEHDFMTPEITFPHSTKINDYVTKFGGYCMWAGLLEYLKNPNIADKKGSAHDALKRISTLNIHHESKDNITIALHRLIESKDQLTKIKSKIDTTIPKNLQEAHTRNDNGKQETTILEQSIPDPALIQELIDWQKDEQKIYQSITREEWEALKSTAPKLEDSIKALFQESGEAISPLFFPESWKTTQFLDENKREWDLRKYKEWLLSQK